MKINNSKKLVENDKMVIPKIKEVIPENTIGSQSISFNLFKQK